MSPAEHSGVLRALVVEDDLWMRPVISPALKLAIPGVMIDWVESAEEGMKKTQLESYSVIVADINLKPNRATGLDFWYFCREECPETPILLTSTLPVDDFVEKMGLYFAHYLPKPFTATDCREVIRNLVAYSSLCS